MPPWFLNRSLTRLNVYEGVQVVAREENHFRADLSVPFEVTGGRSSREGNRLATRWRLLPLEAMSANVPLVARHKQQGRPS